MTAYPIEKGEGRGGREGIKEAITKENEEKGKRTVAMLLLFFTPLFVGYLDWCMRAMRKVV